MKVTWDCQTCTISLLQEPYINSILAKYNFVDMKPVAIPLNPHIQLLEKQFPKSMSKIACMHNIPYRQAVGSLIYLATGAWLDITFATSFVFQFNANPSLEHWEAVKQIYQYLIGMKSLMLTFRTQMRGLIGYVDTDGATQEHWCAITRFAFFVDVEVILWGLKKQEFVMLSTAESEYIAATHAINEALWLWWLIGKMF